MTTLVSFVRRHSLAVFFTLAFGISWGSFYVLGGPALFTLGPFIAALVVAALTNGVSGLRDVARRILRWRVRPMWFAAALLVPVAMGLAVVALTTALGGTVAPAVRLGSWYSPLLLFAVLLLTGDTLFEETGWRAFALPRFPAGRSALADSLILGVLLAAWHLPVALSEPAAVVPYLVATVASAVVTNWVYYSGSESALLAWLYHTSANTVAQFFIPLFVGPSLATYFWMLAGVNVVTAVVLVAATRGTLGRRDSAGASSSQRVVSS